MTRTLVVLGCAALLAMGLSTFTFAGSIPDVDGDGVPDQFDNCQVLDNGPLQATFSCNGQEDGNIGGVGLNGPDGYGNPCDTDFNNDGATGLNDVSLVFAAASVASTNLIYDTNCDGAAGLNDVSKTFANASVAAVPGPSGLACAGTVPCIAQ